MGLSAPERQLSGTYSPTITAGTNLTSASLTAGTLFQFEISGAGVVTIRGFVNIDPIIAGAIDFTASLPPEAHPTFSTVFDASGYAIGSDGSGGLVVGSVGTDDIEAFVNAAGTGVSNIVLSCQYRIST